MGQISAQGWNVVKCYSSFSVNRYYGSSTPFHSVNTPERWSYAGSVLGVRAQGSHRADTALPWGSHFLLQEGDNQAMTAKSKSYDAKDQDVIRPFLRGQEWERQSPEKAFGGSDLSGKILSLSPNSGGGGAAARRHQNKKGLKHQSEEPNRSRKTEGGCGEPPQWVGKDHLEDEITFPPKLHIHFLDEISGP